MAKKKHVQRKPECWWCSRPEASNEDVVPLWIGRQYPEPANWIHENAHPELGHYHVKKARRPAVKSRKFCGKCNNGWMAKLEEEVIPLLAPMMRGQPTRLSVEQQQLLAFWVTKTVLAFQTLQDDSHRFITRSHYRELERVLRGTGPIASAGKAEPALARLSQWGQSWPISFGMTNQIRCSDQTRICAHP